MNKTCIITGTNIGFETARIFARSGYKVVMAVRNIEKGKECRHAIIQKYRDSNITVVNLDLASLASIGVNYLGGRFCLHCCCLIAYALPSPHMGKQGLSTCLLVGTNSAEGSISRKRYAMKITSKEGKAYGDSKLSLIY
jgi:hypothetical protein